MIAVYTHGVETDQTSRKKYHASLSLFLFVKGRGETSMIAWVYNLELVMLVFSSIMFVVPLPPFQTSFLKHPTAFLYRNFVITVVFGNGVFIFSSIVLVRFEYSESVDASYELAGWITLAFVVLFVITSMLYRALKNCIPVLCYSCTRVGSYCGPQCRRMANNSEPSVTLGERVLSYILAMVLGSIVVVLLPSMAAWATGLTWIVATGVFGCFMSCASDIISTVLVMAEAPIMLSISITFSAACVYEKDDLVAQQSRTVYGVAIAIVVVLAMFHSLWNYGIRSMCNVFQYADDDIEDYREVRYVESDRPKPTPPRLVRPEADGTMRPSSLKTREEYMHEERATAEARMSLLRAMDINGPACRQERSQDDVPPV